MSALESLFVGLEDSPTTENAQRERFTLLTESLPRETIHQLIYWPLNGSEIRVLRIHPGERHDPVACTIEHILLPEHYEEIPFVDPGFAALSYSWGDPNVTTDIRLDGQRFPVTTNLHAALVQIREFLKAPEDEQPASMRGARFDDFRLWVDAVCINQLDADEKSRQVRRMGDLYFQAGRVIAWLGNPTEGDDDLMGAVFNLGRIAQMGIKAGMWQSSCDMDLRGVLDDTEFEKLVRAYCMLEKRSWFRRRWVIQEAVLALSASLVMGSWHCSMQDLGLAASALSGRLRDDVPQEAKWKGHLYRLSHLPFMLILKADVLQARLAGGSSSGRILVAGPPGVEEADGGLERFLRELFQLLSKTTDHFDSTLPHDCLYALLGLLRVPSTLPPDLQPDYEKPFAQVCHDWARRLLPANPRGGLDSLSSVRREIPGVPSWVPDLRYAHVVDHVKIHTTAAGLRISPDGQRLSFAAVRVGRVAAAFRSGLHVSKPPAVWEIETLVELLGVAAEARGLPDVRVVFREWAAMVGRRDVTPERSLFDICETVYEGRELVLTEVGMAAMNCAMRQFRPYMSCVTDAGRVFSLERKDENAQLEDLLVIPKGTCNALLLRPVRKKKSVAEEDDAHENGEGVVKEKEDGAEDSEAENDEEGEEYYTLVGKCKICDEIEVVYDEAFFASQTLEEFTLV